MHPGEEDEFISKAEQKVVWATHYAPAADLFQQQQKVGGHVATFRCAAEFGRSGGKADSGKSLARAH
jgi:hypothetical protein